MGIKSFSRDAKIEYVPNFGFNRLEKDPCVVTMGYLSHTELIDLELKTKNLQSTDDEVRAIEVNCRAQFKEKVFAIKGYFLNGVEITDIDEFYRTASQKLVLELLKAMKDSALLDMGQLKNLPQVSGGQPSSENQAQPHSSAKPAPPATKTLETAETD